jgi:hypothetical protein
VRPRAIPDILDKTKIFVLTTIRTLDHPDSETDTVQPTTPQLPKYHPTTGHDSQRQPFYNLEKNPVPTVLEAGEPQGQSGLVHKTLYPLFWRQVSPRASLDWYIKPNAHTGI